MIELALVGPPLEAFAADLLAGGSSAPGSRPSPRVIGRALSWAMNGQEAMFEACKLLGNIFHL